MTAEAVDADRLRRVVRYEAVVKQAAVGMSEQVQVVFAEGEARARPFP